jgi:hypothetical protein
MPRMYVGGKGVWLHSFLTLVLDGCEWSTSSHACINSIRDSGGQTDRLNFLERRKILAYVGIQSPDSPASSLVIIPSTLSQHAD